MMKRISLFSILSLMVVAVLTFSSCEPDTSSGTDSPVIQLLDGTGVVSSDVTLDPGSTMTLRVSASSGAAELNSLRVYEDGVSINTSRLTYNGTAASANPALLFDGDRTSLIWDITIVVHSDAATRNYSVEVTDADGLTASTSVAVSINPFTGPLSLSFVEQVPYIWSDATVAGDSFFKVRLVGQRGATSALNSLTVLEDGTSIGDVTRLRYEGFEFPTNPVGLPVDAVDGFDAEIEVRAHATSGTREYTFLLEDESGATSSVSVNITVAPTGTAVTSLTGALLNSAGPTGTGGLDLETGTSMGSTAAGADIRDLGIDGSLPLAQNWKQKFAGSNGAILRTTSYDFNSISFKEEIATAWSEGTTIAETQTVNIGDTYLVDNGTNTFIILVTNVIVTSSDNNDKYEFSIKY